MNTYVVSGVTGHVGSVVASELLDRGKKIRAIVRNPKQGGKLLQIVDIPPAGHVAALKQAGFPADTAEAYAEMHAAIAAGLVTPKGDRSLTGTTPIDEVLPGLLAGSQP
jgi:nucleoside-diphosphate-sugar epimerase